MYPLLDPQVMNRAGPHKLTIYEHPLARRIGRNVDQPKTARRWRRWSRRRTGRRRLLRSSGNNRATIFRGAWFQKDRCRRRLTWIGLTPCPNQHGASGRYFRRSNKNTSRRNVSRAGRLNRPRDRGVAGSLNVGLESLFVSRLKRRSGGAQPDGDERRGWLVQE